MITDVDIIRAAKELLERYGENAASVAQDRVTALADADNQSEMNIALRVLSALEVLIKGKTPAA